MNCKSLIISLAIKNALCQHIAIRPMKVGPLVYPERAPKSWGFVFSGGIYENSPYRRSY